MDGIQVNKRVCQALAWLLIAACLLACCAVPAQAVVAETVMVGGTLVVATALVALGFFALSDTRLGDVAQRIVDAAATAGVPWLTADREIAVLEFGIGVARRVARQVINWVKSWVTDPANSALVGAWRADIEVGAVYPLSGSEYIDPAEFLQTHVLSDEHFAAVWNESNYGAFTEYWNAAKADPKFIAIGVGHIEYSNGRRATQYWIQVLGAPIDEIRSVKVTSLNPVYFTGYVTPEGEGSVASYNSAKVSGVWWNDGTFSQFTPAGTWRHDPANNEGVIAINYGGPGIVYDGADLLAGTIGTVYPDWDALGDADTLPLAVPDSLSSLVGVTAEQAQTVVGSEEPEPEPSPSAPPAPLPDEVGGLWQYVRALIDDMAAALSQVGAFITALPPAIVVPVWAAVALLVIIGLIRAFVGG